MEIEYYDIIWDVLTAVYVFLIMFNYDDRFLPSVYILLVDYLFYSIFKVSCKE